MKKIILCLLFFFTPLVSANIYITPEAPKTNVGAYILIDQKTGKILAEKDANKHMEPASLTKLMTSYIVFSKLQENIISLDDKVRISQKAWKTGGSKTFIKVNDHIRLEDLLKGMIIQSGNDASVALAEHVAGSENTFADLMNQYAKALGLTNSHFENASGLPSANQYTSAQDMATLARRIIADFPEYYKWYSQKSFSFNNIKQTNRNRLLWLDSSVDGLKTGHTNSAGYCLVTSAERLNMRLISVILNAKSSQERIDDTQRILDYGFRFFETQTVTKPGEVLTEIELFKGKKSTLAVGLSKDEYLTVARGRFKDLSYQLKIEKSVSAPISINKEVGTVNVLLDDEVLGSYPLVALESIEEAGFLGRIIDSIKLIFN